MFWFFFHLFQVSKPSNRHHSHRPPPLLSVIIVFVHIIISTFFPLFSFHIFYYSYSYNTAYVTVYLLYFISAYGRCNRIRVQRQKIISSAAHRVRVVGRVFRCNGIIVFIMYRYTEI